MTRQEKTIAVVGIGNSLLTDDGAGIHTLERFAEDNDDDGVCCLDGGTVGLALLDRLANLNGLVALDAMKLGKKPGAVTVLRGKDMDSHLRNQHGSVHEVGLSDLMDALRSERSASRKSRAHRHRTRRYGLGHGANLDGRCCDS